MVIVVGFVSDESLLGRVPVLEISGREAMEANLVTASEDATSLSSKSLDCLTRACSRPH